IQGTGAVALAGVLSAMRITGGKLSAQSFLFLGAGTASVGIARTLTQALTAEGLSSESTRRDLADYQQPYAHPHTPTRDFTDAIESIRPTVIIGASTAAKAFDSRVI